MIQFIKKGGGSSFKVPNGMKFAYSSVIPETLDTSNVVTAKSMFNYCTSLTSLPQINTSKITKASGFCANCTNLTSLPQINTSKVTDAQNFCTTCSSLVNVPELDFSSIVELAGTHTYCKDMFSNCPSLSNESLNNILAMCVTMNPYYTHRTLKRIGLSSAQATTCQGLSNWDAFVAAGWTTGY